MCIYVCVYVCLVYYYVLRLCHLVILLRGRDHAFMGMVSCMSAIQRQFCIEKSRWEFEFCLLSGIKKHPLCTFIICSHYYDRNLLYIGSLIFLLGLCYSHLHTVKSFV